MNQKKLVRGGGTASYRWTMVEAGNASNNRAGAHQVLWLPCPPQEGSLSMDRYWSELERQRREREPGDLRIRSALPQPPVTSRRESRGARFWQKYVRYPWTARRQASKPGVELVHVLDHAFAALLRQVPVGVRTVATVHDLAPLRVPGSLTAAQQERFRRAVGNLRRADLLLADSRHTAQDMVELVGCDEARIRVLPLGADLAQFGAPQPAPLSDWDARLAGRRVVISVGSVPARKNLEVLPGFLAGLKAAGHAVALVRIGDALPAPLATELRGVLGEDLLELGKVPGEQLAGAYQRAALLILPSRLEGFGLPVLEAMAAGCPVVSSNASSLPEVGGEAALYFDLDEPAAAAAHARRLLEDEPARQERVRAGREWAARFSWEAHFAALTEIYREVLATGIPPFNGAK